MPGRYRQNYNDFYVARNTCLPHVSGEWFLYQDDEWFDNISEFVESFSGQECEMYHSGCYHTRDYNADGKYTIGIASRVIRRKEDTCFVGKIHETFNDMPEPTKYFRSFTHHMGYVYTTSEAQMQKHERNMKLRQEELEREGYTLRVCAQMV